MSYRNGNPASAGGRTVGDGREDFDFLIGTWRTWNRRLTSPFNPACEDHEEFEALTEVRPVLFGLGNQDTITAERGPGGQRFQGLTLRLFDPDDKHWRIWWASTRRPGRLDEPMVGRFDGGRGIFHGRESAGGTQLDVRFVWERDGDAGARWEQSFSFDGMRTWLPNWVMTFTPDT